MRRHAAAAVLLVGLFAQQRESAARPADLVVDGGFVASLPAGLPTGLSTGVGAGVATGGVLAFGARASWSSATEYSLTTTVRDDDFRLRAHATLQRDAGRGTFALRLGLGATLVRESVTRDQGERAGLEGDALQSIQWALLPAADLEAAVVLRVHGAFGVVVSGGPSLHLLAGAVQAGWIGGLGVVWQN